MRHTSVCLIFAAWLGISMQAHAQAPPSSDRPAAEVALSSETLQLRYDTPSDLGGEGSRMAYGLFLSEDRDVVGSAALLLKSDLNFGYGPLELRFGPQAYVALLNEQNQDVFSLTVGLDARWNLVPSRGIAIAGSAFYGPDILTFGQADQLTDFMARGEIQVNERLLVFAGYRWFRLDLVDRDSRNLQNEFLAGVRWRL
ncbi:MAG TPA: YfaZ family outer membrane protein [Steroidobacteraceae bacterium]|nr:YfaZ family outer membrane protein [Steroidobacteraceae bacterium]